MADLYQPSGAEELSQRFLRDVRLAASSVGDDEPPVGQGSDFWLTSQGIAGIGLQGFGNISLSEADQNVLTATDQALDNIRIGYGLPEVSASPGRGKLVITVSGVTTVPNGQAFLYPNGASGKVIGTYLNPADQSEINVECTESGTKGNLKAGQKVRFINPPINLVTEAVVSQGAPITGGTDKENDPRKRERILNVLRNKPAGGNWAYIRQVVLDSNGGVSDCFVYPALGGPSSVKVVPVKDFDIVNIDFSRTVSDSTLSAIRSQLQSLLPVEVQVVVQAAVSEFADATLKVTIPNSSQSGGNGSGWVDINPWPQLVGGDAGKVTLSSPSPTFSSFTISAQTATSPVAGISHIAWWSSADRKFYTGLIVSKSGTSGAWVVGLDRPLVDSTGAGPVSGDYVCPAAQNLFGYGKEWIETFRSFGPGENTAIASRLLRGKRHPAPAERAPHSITNSILKSITSKYPEITDFSLGYTLVTAPTVPSNTVTAPNILIPRRFAVYSL